MRLLYIADPMCSWCWGFAPQLAQVLERVDDRLDCEYVMGGLARDCDEPMPEDVRAYVQQAWAEVQARTGAEFNHDFWSRCEPRRSTYPACRAVLAAGLQSATREMFRAIQRAYYSEARNPSDLITLTELAGELSLDVTRFSADLAGAAVEDALQQGFQLRRRLGVRTFPTLLVEQGEQVTLLAQGFAEFDAMAPSLNALLA